MRGAQRRAPASLRYGMMYPQRLENSAALYASKMDIRVTDELYLRKFADNSKKYITAGAVSAMTVLTIAVMIFVYK